MDLRGGCCGKARIPGTIETISARCPIGASPFLGNVRRAESPWRLPATNESMEDAMATGHNSSLRLTMRAGERKAIVA